MTHAKTISYERLHEVLDYDQKTGVFRWKVGVARNVKTGAVAGYKNDLGYIKIGLDGSQHSAHRLAWLYVYGYLPENNIDHINRVCDDNRIANLREVSQQCNLRNSKTPRNNTSGVCGVCYSKFDNKWRTAIMVNRKQYYIGLSVDFDEAVCHRLAVEQCLNWEGCDSSSDAYNYVQKMLGNI